MNEANTDWFDTTSFVEQDDSSFLTLFGIYINNLIVELNSYDIGVKLRDINISILLFAKRIIRFNF